MDSRLLWGAVETLILEVVGQGPTYGYEIAQTVTSRSKGYFELKEGSLYPALHRLEQQKLITSSWQEVDGRRRKYYKLSFAGQRALIADDDPVTRYLIANILSQRRIAFDEAANGADAVKSLKAHEYTIVFLDLLMPRVDGWGVIDFLRRSKTKPPRIVIITGVKDQTLSVADRELVTGIIYKPLDPGEVDRVVQQTLSGVVA